MKKIGVWVAISVLPFIFTGVAFAEWVDQCDGSGGGTTLNSVLDACPSGIGGYLRAPNGSKFCTTDSEAWGYCYYGPAGQTTGKAQDAGVLGCVDGGIGTDTCTVHTKDENDCINSVPKCYGTPVTRKPKAPAYLSATAGSGEIDLSWESVTGAASYAVKRSFNAGGSYSSVSGASTVLGTSFTHTQLTNGTTYYYVVTAKNAGGTSGYSPEASATPEALPPPDAPDLYAVAGNTEVDLSWSPVSGADKYTLRRSKSSGSGYVKVKDTSATSFTNTGLTNGTTYYYVVTAGNANGTSPYSTEAVATPDVPPPIPATPKKLAGVVGNLRVTLSWDAALHATDYTVRLRLTPKGLYTSFTTGGATAYTKAGLVSGTTYYFTVLSSNSTGASKESKQISIVACADGTGDGIGVYKDAVKQAYCRTKTTSAGCGKVFGCLWSATQCNRKIMCTYTKAALNSTDLLCARYTGDESGCGKFVSCLYTSDICAKK